MLDSPVAETPLSGVSVLDLSQGIAGGYCTKLLADHGADVIKIEPPGGDSQRAAPPFHLDDADPEKSGSFLHLSTNKRSVTLDAASRAGRKIVLALAEQADMVVESFAPKGREALGLDYASLSRRRPGLVVVSITGFGRSGPYRDFKTSEIVTYAMGGPMHATGLPGREPMKLGENVLQYHAGACASSAAMIALWKAEMTGEGDHVELSLFRAQAANQDRRTTMLVGYQYTGENNLRKIGSSVPGTGVRICADGYVHLMAGEAKIADVARMMGQPELLEDPRFATATARARPTASDEFDEHLLPFTLQHSKRDLFQLAQANQIPSGPLYDSSDLLGDPVFEQRGMWERVTHPAAGALKQVGRPFIMHGSPRRPLRPAPLLGEHTAEVLCGRLGVAPQELAALRREGVV